MKKGQVIKISLIIAFLSTLIYSITYFGDSAISSSIAGKQVFPDSTFIADVDLSARTAQEAKVQLEDRLALWKSSTKIDFLYKEQIYQISPANFQFFIDQSIEAAVPGTRNEFIVELSEQAIEGLSIPVSISINLDNSLLEKELLKAGRSLLPSFQLNLDSFLPEEEEAVISEARIELPDGFDDVTGFSEAVPSIEIGPESQFSLAVFAQNEGVDPSSAAFTLIASAMYRAILPTNFTISERHISSRIPEYIEPGYEAKVDFAKKQDFMFYNPNKLPYIIHLRVDQDVLSVSITGVPLLYEYKVTASGKKEFKPRIIKQYSPLLSTGQKKVEKEGEPGVLVGISREIFTMEGELLKRELLSEDFYRPVHRIEVLPLLPPVLQTELSSPTQAGNYPGVELTDGEESGVGENEDGISETVHIPAEPKEETEDDGGLWGNPNEEPK